MGANWQIQGLIAALLVALTLAFASSADAAYAGVLSDPIIVPGDELLLAVVISIKIVIFAVLAVLVTKAMRESK